MPGRATATVEIDGECQQKVVVDFDWTAVNKILLGGMTAIERLSERYKATIEVLAE